MALPLLFLSIWGGIECFRNVVGATSCRVKTVEADLTMLQGKVQNATAYTFIITKDDSPKMEFPKHKPYY